MARPMGTGPIHIWIGFGPPDQVTYSNAYGSYVGPDPVRAAQALYYGTTRTGVDIDEILDYYPVMNDITGPKQSMDEGFAGREDGIGMAMTSWTQLVENMLEHILDPLNVRNPIGTDDLQDLGTLMLSEGKTVGIWMRKAAALKPINIAAGMPLGRYYPTCIMDGPSKIIEGNKENIMIRAFTAKKDVNKLNLGKLPLLYTTDALAGFSLLPEPTFG